MGNLTRMNITADELNEFLAESLVKLSYYDKFVDYDTVTGLIMALNAGEIVVIGIDRNTAEYIASRNEHFVTRIPNDGQFTLNYSLLFREENRELCEKVSGIIREMKNDGSMDALKKAYIDDVIVGSDPEKIVPEFFEGAETISYLTAPNLYVVLDSSPLADILEPSEE